MDSSHSPAELYQQALKLSTGDRAVLAGLLLDSLDASTEDNVDEAWRAEIERRMLELDTGAVTPVAWEQVRVRFHPQAADEAQRAYDWYYERNPSAAQAFSADLEHAINRVSDAPERWPLYHGHARRYVFQRFPFRGFRPD